MALLASLAAAVATPAVRARTDAACTDGRAQPATLSIEGNLYAMVRAADERFAFGWSGKPVLSFPEALTLIRHLGFKGTDAQLLRRLSQSQIPGVDFADGGASSDFIFTCRGSYRATALVRSDRRSITGTRFWLRQGETRIARAFCMPEQWVPAEALVSVSFRIPRAHAAGVRDRLRRQRQDRQRRPVPGGRGPTSHRASAATDQ
jgi:hypothetical protein